MIITCPECDTRYDLEERHFLPKGRSVRCTVCGESWYVPAPDPLEMKPVQSDAAQTPPASDDNDDALGNTARAETPNASDNENMAATAPQGSILKFGIAEDSAAVDEPAEAPLTAGGPTFSPSADEIIADQPAADINLTDKASDVTADEDDRLFAGANDEPEQARVEEQSAADTKGWRRGPKFFMRDNDDDAEDGNDTDDVSHGDNDLHAAAEAKAKAEEEPAGEDDDEKPRGGIFGAKQSSPKKPSFGKAEEPSNLDADEVDEEDEYDASAYDDDDDEVEDLAAARIVDADFEDLGGGRFFGRKARAERRRATALARMEDVRRYDPEMFDEEFFASLRVTPRELERAVRRARRRAEVREANRMTPWRAMGWTAWAAMVLALVYGLFAFRQQIVQTAPATADAYEVVGVETKPVGFVIENVRHRVAMSPQGPVIEISGELRNRGDARVSAPLLQAEALGENGELLSRWTFAPDAADLDGGAIAAFTTRSAAPEGVSEVALSLAPLSTSLGPRASL